jgi:hypothetical protein
MKIILALGAPGAGHEAVFAALTEAGVAPAKPSRRDGHTPQELGRLLLQALEVEPNGHLPLQQLRPGKVWQELATDLTVANLEQPVWGWADHQLAGLLDFWHDFDSQVRFLLVYTSPVEFLSHRFQQGGDVATTELESGLREWLEWNTALLRYHLRNPQHSLLIDGQAALREPDALRQLLQDAWGVAGLEHLAPKASVPGDAEALLAQATHGLIAPDHEVWALQEQLDNVAQLTGTEPTHPAFNAVSAWTAARALIASHQQATQQIETLHQRCDALQTQSRVEGKRAEDKIKAAEAALKSSQSEWQKERAEWANADKTLKQENELLLLQLHQVQEELERSFLQCQELQQAQSKWQKERAEWANERDALTRARAALTTQLEARRAEPAPAKPADESLKQENELLLLQLHQVQEELERYFLQCQELQQARGDGFLSEFWRTHQPEVVTVDLRRPISGEQWYAAEADGRWTGPATLATLDLPPLQPGKYLLELDVLEAMAPDILDAAHIEFEGRQHPVAVEYMGGEGVLPAICSTQLTINGGDGRAPLRMGIGLPRTFSPAADGSPDNRELGVRVQQLRLIRQPNGIVAE